jgi:hypothetical protein
MGIAGVAMDHGETAGSAPHRKRIARDVGGAAQLGQDAE